MKRLIAAIISLTILTGGICSCSNAEADIEQTDDTSSPSITEVQVDSDVQILYRYASAEEGVELMMANTEYYDGFSQNDLDYKLAQSGATMEDYLEFAREQVLDFDEDEIAKIDNCFRRIEDIISENGYELPPIDEIILIKTTMDEEPGAGAYTHGTEIYLGDGFIDVIDEERLTVLLCHEMFHCLTRCNPEFREEMYSLINFTVVDHDFELPESVFEYHISNPDVEHHNSYATFIIHGQEIDCFTDFVTTMHYDESQSDFFSCGTTALIPIDGSDLYYTPDEAENFYDVFGMNTGYVIDPEECMADNFSYAMVYGMDGFDGEGYPNPEIIEGILTYLGASFVG